MSNGVEYIPMFAAISGALMYVVTARIKPKYFFGTRWDAKIPLLPLFVVPYILFFPYGVGTLLALIGTPYLNPFLLAMGIAGWMAGAIWYFAPASMLRPKIIKNDVLSGLIALIYRLDAQANTFPSAHVFYALICTYFLSLAFPEFVIIFVAIAALIVLSTLFVRQHHLADVAGGAAWAITAISVAHSLWV